MLYMVPYLATKGGSKMSFVILTDADSASEAKSFAAAVVKFYGKARPDFNLEGYFKSFAAVAPEVDDLPEEDTVDFGWLERYEVADDKKSFILKHQQDNENTAGAAENSRTTEKPQVVQEQQKTAGDTGASGSEKMLAHQPLGDGDLPSHNQEPRAYFAKMSAGTRKVAVLMHGFGVIDMVLTKAQMKEVIVTSLDKGDLYYSTMLDALRLPAIDIMGPEQFASFVAGVGRRFEKGDPDVNLTSVRNFVTQILATENFEESYTSAVKPVEELPRTSSGALASTGAKPANGRPINNFEELRTVTYLAHYPADFNVSNPPGAIINAINEAKKRKDKSPETWFGQLRETPGVMNFSFEAVNTLIRNAPENLHLTPGALRTYINANLIEIEAPKNVKAEPLLPGATDVLADDQPTNETVADAADNAGDATPPAQDELATGAENIASNDGEKQEVATEQESDPPRRIKIRDAILSSLSGETCVMSPDEVAELLTYVGEGISHSYLARLLAKEIEPCDPFQQLTDDQIHHLTFDALEQWMDDKEARCQLINELVELYLSENTSNEGEKTEVGQQQEGELHSMGGGKFEFDASTLFASSPLATDSTSTDLRENEDLTTENVREFLDPSTNPADLSGETAQLSGEGVTRADEQPTEKQVNSAPPYFEPGRYHDIPNEIYHSANGISSTMAKDARISLMYYHGRHVIKSLQRERTDALTFGSLVHTLALEPEKLDAEFSVEPLIPEGAFTDTASMRAFIDKHNAALPKQADADTLRAVIEKHNATLPVPYALGGNADEIGQFYGLLPVEFQRIGEDQKPTATAMKACIKEYNATLPVPLKTSGSRDALLEQLEVIDPAFVELERAIPAPLPVSGSKEEMAARIKTILPTAIFADELISAWKNNNDQRQTITQAQMKHAKAIQHALLSHPLAGQWLQHPQRATEVSYFGIEEETGLDVRVRPDLEVDTGARRIAFDLKTVSLPYVKQDNLRHRLHREIIERDYHMSAGMYCDVGMFDQFFWIFVNKEPGYHWVTVVEASADELALGRAIYKQQLAAIRNAMDTGIWPEPITEVFTDTLTDYELSRLKELNGEPS